MKPEVQREYDRIKAGPQKGYFTLLHHEGPIVEYSDDVMERVYYILSTKPEDEHYTRLRHIHAVHDATADEYWVKRLLIEDEYWAKREPVDEEYLAKLRSTGEGYKATLRPIDEEHQAKVKPILEEHQAKVKPIVEEYLAKRKAIDEEFLVPLIPDHSWDGLTIFNDGGKS